MPGPTIFAQRKFGDTTHKLLFHVIFIFLPNCFCCVKLFFAQFISKRERFENLAKGFVFKNSRTFGASAVNCAGNFTSCAIRRNSSQSTCAEGA